MYKIPARVLMYDNTLLILLTIYFLMQIIKTERRVLIESGQWIVGQGVPVFLITTRYVKCNRCE